MKTAVLVLLGLALVAGIASADDTSMAPGKMEPAKMEPPSTESTAMQPMKMQPTEMQGEMVCMWCDCVIPALADKKDEPHKCMAAFQATDGKVYTLAPDKIGKELGDIKMHEQKVELEAYVLPKSQIIEVYSYKITDKVEPRTPETNTPENPWFNF